MIDYYEKYRDVANEKFKNHVATIVEDTDSIISIDFRNKSGSSSYYINYIIDKRYGTFIISGDIGYCIAEWSHPQDASSVKGLIKDDPEYFISKFKTSTDKTYYDEDKLYSDIMELVSETQLEDAHFMWDSACHMNDNDENYTFEDDLKYSIHWSTFRSESKISDELRAFVLEYFGIDLYEMSYIGEAVAPRVYLWIFGYLMACEQLGL